MAGINHERVVAHQDKGLAEDWNKDHKQKGDHDCEQHQHLNHVIENRDDFPAGPVAGQIIFRTDYNNGLIFNGTNWKSIVPAFLIVVASDGSGDYLTIQEGIDALPATGGIVHIKTGTYTITTDIIINVDDTTLEGDFHGTVIQTTTADISLIKVNGNDRIVIKDLFLYGGGAGKNNAGIEWLTAHEGRIENCYIQNCEGMGIYMECSDANLINNNVVRDCWNWAVLMLECDDNIFTNNFIYDIKEETWATGLEINDCHKNIFNNNNIEFCEWEGLYIWGSTFNNVEGNMISNNSFGNVNQYAGILLEGTSTHNTIIGNKSYDDQVAHTQRYGIREAGGVDNYNTITNNTCVDNVTADVSTQGAQTIEDNNMTLP